MKVKRQIAPTVAAVAMAALVLAGCETTSVGEVRTIPAVASVAVPVSDYRVSSYDVLEIAVFQVDNLSRTVQVSAAGTVTMPLIGEVRAAGLTTKEIEKTIRDKLAEKYLQNPLVSVTVKSASAQSVTVDGAVLKPGVFPLTGTVTLAQAVAMAGGLNEIGNRSGVTVTRAVEGGRTISSYDVERIQKGEAEDPILVAGDIVLVPQSGAKVLLNSATRTMVPVLQGASATRWLW